MYIYSDIISAYPSGLYKLVGWRQDTETGSVTLDTANKTTGSGLYFQDGSALVTVTNIKQTMEEVNAADLAVNSRLLQMQYSGIQKIADAVFNDLSLIESKLLFPYENVMDNTLTNDTAFVGFELTVPFSKEILNRINKIISEFDTASDTVTVYLFHSSQKTAIKSYAITTQANSSKIENLSGNDEWMLRYSGSNYAAGKWYIGYNRGSLTAKAINREWGNAVIQNRFACLGIKSIKVSGHSAATLFDIDDIEYTSDTYGLNFDISSYWDKTNTIIDNARAFAKAIQMQVCADALELFLNSARINQRSGVTAQQASAELSGTFTAEGKPVTLGLYTRLNREIKALRQRFATGEQFINQTTS